ncbi:5-bromo-4-chloroindolyl phosphate hydrolysis family protein [Rossellomorea marisflavi]|uniref:5-bromo-4-chloroindolyl phosphate hydrolysis family protein n=1 Tax=Rossellomorea marisflavi TaxID=189381 RepID=UPI0040447842
MNTFLQVLTRTGIGWSAGAAGFFTYLLAFDLGFFISVAAAVGTSFLVFYSTKQIQKHLWLKKNGITRREYIFITRNLKEAKLKINRLQRQQLKVRSLGAFRQILELSRLSKRIYQLAKREPRRFFKAESFFYYHLDSVVEITEKYTFLASQPGKDKEAFKSLQQTKTTLDELSLSLEQDLRKVLADDMDTLHFELDFAKKRLEEQKTIK